MKPAPDNLFVIVRWNDAWKSGILDISAENVSHYHSPTDTYTVGWVQRDDEKGILICNEWSPEDKEFRGPTFVPRGMVIETVPVTLSKKRAKPVATVDVGGGTGNQPQT